MFFLLVRVCDPNSIFGRAQKLTARLFEKTKFFENFCESVVVVKRLGFCYIYVHTLYAICSVTFL